MVSVLLIMAMIFTLNGCGNATPAINEDLAEGSESTENTAAHTVGTETEVKGGEAAVTETSVESSAPVQSTSTHEPTAEPTESPEPTAASTEKPQATATPEPTAPPHVHEYAESITKQPTCAEAGVKTLTCSCGEVKTEPVAATGHDFVTQYTTVEHASVGHVEQVQVQVGTTRRSEYECAYCGTRFDTPEAKDEHQLNSGDFEHAFARTIIWDYDEPIYETTSSWVIDSPAWSEQVPNGSVCTKCGVAGP